MTHTPDPNSTYTTALNLEKAPNGSFDDEWEALANDNLDLIDAGVLAASRSANIILTGQVANEDLPQYSIVYPNAYGWNLASDVDTFYCNVGRPLGIMLDAIAESATGRVQIFGAVEHVGWAFVPYEEVWLGFNSVVTDTETVGGRNGGYGSIRLGAALSATSIWFNPIGITPAAAPALGVKDLAASAGLTGYAPRIVTVDTTAGDVAVTLPVASDVAGCLFVLKKRAPSATTYGATFVAASGDTIDGAASTPPITAQYGVVRVISDGWTSWHII